MKMNKQTLIMIMIINRESALLISHHHDYCQYIIIVLYSWHVSCLHLLDVFFLFRFIRTTEHEV